MLDIVQYLVKKNEQNANLRFSVFSFSDTVLSILYILLYIKQNIKVMLVLLFIDKRTKIERLSNLPKVMKLLAELEFLPSDSRTRDRILD